MDFLKNRLWSCEFYQTRTFMNMPQLALAVEEEEEYPYRIPIRNFHPYFPAGYGGQLTVCLAGRGILCIGDREYEVGPSQAFLYNYRDSRISYYSPRNSPEKWRFLWVHLRGQSAEDAITEINRRWGYFFDLGDDGSLQQLLQGFRRFAGGCCYLSGSENCALAAEIIHLLVAKFEQQMMSPNLAFPVNTIQERLDRVDRIGDLAEEIGLSGSHLSRSYHALTGETMLSYRQHRRLDTAMEYLLKTSLSLKEIAVKAGFNTYSSFFRAFVREYRHSPRFFRKGQRQS